MRVYRVLLVFIFFTLLQAPLSAQEKSAPPSDMEQILPDFEEDAPDSAQPKAGLVASPDTADPVAGALADDSGSSESGSHDVLVDDEREDIVEELDDITIIEEDEDLLLMDDKEELIIGDEKATVMEKPVQTDTLQNDNAVDVSQEKSGTGIQEDGAGSSQRNGMQQQSATVVNDGDTAQILQEQDAKKEKNPITIESTRSIDFAKNLKEYRSPKRAMLMSFLLPGLGQAYSKKYVKTAIFGVVEAACIGFAIKFNRDGNAKKEDARDFADINFSSNNFFKFYEQFIQFAEAESIAVDVGQLFYDSLSSYKQKYDSTRISNHTINDRQSFDTDIESDAFTQGWRDCQPGFNATDGYALADSALFTYSFRIYSADSSWRLNIYEKNDTTKVIRKGVFGGYSEHQKTYSRMMSRSNSFYKYSNYFIYMLVANHVVSAMDAFISARAYNDRLMNGKSVWDHIHLDHRVALTEQGFESRFGIRVGF